MPYYEIKDFAAGLDLRKGAITSPAGTLRKLTNAQVSAGGEIEKRNAYVPWSTANPATTFGLYSSLGEVYTFGVGGTFVPYTPTSVGILPIPSLPGVGTDYQVYDWDLFDNRVYVIIWSAATGIRHYFQRPDGTMEHIPSGPGHFCRTYKSKMHTCAGKVLYFSAVNNPTDWSGTGAGFINLAINDGDMNDLIGLEVYYDYLAVMSRDATQLWSIDPDPALNQLQQTLRQAGTAAAQSLRQYGSGDVLFLGYDGIRSLKARTQSVSAAVSDIGSPIDPLVKGYYETFGTGFMGTARALLQPYTGRYWMTVYDRTLVLSNFPTPKISAWSLYLHGFGCTYATEAGNALYLRGDDATGNTIYKYGGDGVPIYDSSTVEIELPFLHFEKPATFKKFYAIDVVCTGNWQVYAAFNPADPTVEELIGTVTGPTFLTGQFPVMGHSTHISLRFRSTAPGPQTLASIMIHYDLAETT